MQSVGNGYCSQCRGFQPLFVTVGMPPVIALICSVCCSLVATAHSDHDVAYADLPAYAKQFMLPSVPMAAALEAFRQAAFGDES